MAYKPKDQSGLDYASMSGMTAAHQKALAEAGQAWQRANKAGNQAAMDAAHQMAESIRAQYGYSGGEDGSEYISVQAPTQTMATRSLGGYDLSDYLRQQKAAETEAALAALKGAYQKSIAGYDRVKDSLADQYQAAKNQAAAQAVLAKKAFGERAAASGLNSGVTGQAELARSSTLQRDLAGLDSDRAGKLADLDVERTKVQADYEAAIAKAKADGDASLASALYQELVRIQEIQREDEQRQIALDRAAEELIYSREQDAKKWAYQLGRDKLEDERYEEETAYNRALAAQKLAQAAAGKGNADSEKDLELDGVGGPSGQDPVSSLRQSPALQEITNRYARLLEAAIRRGELRMGDANASAALIARQMVAEGYSKDDINFLLAAMNF